MTPYIEPPAGYNQIDLQTFHTRGKPIDNANFQTPGDAEYNGLAALLSVPFGPDGRPEQCVIVTTASARNVRGVDFETFHERTPHGVAGATARAVPALPRPIYFNESVIPDRSRTETSGDGGIIWTEVPAGVYRVITESPTTRFASFLATCEPGRIVNANPPWGAYELSPGEKPLGAGVVAGSVAKVSGGQRAGNRLVIVRLRAAERLRAKLQSAPARQRGRRDQDREARGRRGQAPAPGRGRGGARAGQAHGEAHRPGRRRGHRPARDPPPARARGVSGADADAVRRLLAAVTERDMDAVAAELHPEIEAHGRRGPFRGVDEVVGWAKPNDDGYLSSRVEVDELRQVGDRHVAADARRQWCWKESGEVATRTASASCSSSATGASTAGARTSPRSSTRSRRSRPSERLSRLGGMAEAPSTEAVSARIAEIREGLTLLADYL